MLKRRDSSHANGLSIGVAFLLVGAPASAATLTVGNGSAPCPDATFTTIQSAVDAAQPHDTIDVCPGTYVEQVVVAAGKDGLTLRSREPLAAIVKAPSVMSDPGDVVRIHGARWVTVEGLTIAGPLPNALFCSTSPRTGVRVDGSGSATLRSVHVTEIRSEDPALRGCQNGFAILVGHADEGETGRAAIFRTTIDAYQKGGILVDGAGSSAAIVDDVVTGDGPNPSIAQNGIEISDGADAFVAGNRVSAQSYSPAPLATGMLFYHPGRVFALGNHVRSSDFGVLAIGAIRPEIRGNEVTSCMADGIVIGPGTTKGIIAANESLANGGLDARDDTTGPGTAGTANRWRHDVCKTDNKNGLLCQEGHDDDAD